MRLGLGISVSSETSMVEAVNNLDFSNLNITRMWAPFKTSEATIDYYARVSRNGLTTAGNLMYVFYDEWNMRSLDGQVSSTTTANEDTTLREWFLSGARTDDYTIHTEYCQITAKAMSFQSGQLANSPYFATDMRLRTTNLTPGVYYRGALTSVLDGTALSELGTGQDFTVIEVTNADALGNAYITFNTKASSGGNSSRFNLLNRGDNANVNVFVNTSTTSYIGALSATNNTQRQKELASTVENGGNMLTYAKAVLQDTDAVTGNFDNDTLDFGAGMSGTFPFLGTKQVTIVCNTNISSDDISSINTKLDALLSYDADYNIVCDGNSLTFGTGATAGQEYPTILSNRLNGTFTTRTVTNKGVAGQTAAQMEADAATDIDPLISGSKRNILLAWGARNDLVVDSATVAQAYANIKTYCENRRTAGWEVIVFTITPSWTATYKGDSTVTGYELLNTERLAVNTLIRDNWTTFADGLVDFSLDSDLNTFHNNEQAGYTFSATRPTTSANGLYGDGTHFTDAGYQVISNMAFDEIIKLVHK